VQNLPTEGKTMDQRRYSIKEVQKITQLSPTVLQDLLKKYRNHLTLEVVTGPQGEEVFMDGNSLERLIFLKQLELRQKPTQAESVSQLLPAAAKNQTSANLSQAEVLGYFISALDMISKEVAALEESLQQLVLRYSHVVNDLNVARLENRELQREIEILKTRQNLIIGQMKRDEIFNPDDSKEKGSIN